MSCHEATEVARAAMFRLGYGIEKVVPATPQAPGRIVGRRNSGWAAGTPEGGDAYTAIIEITCSDQGADFTAVTDEPITSRITFRQRFNDAIAEMAKRQVREPSLDKTPRQGLVITVEPQRSSQARSVFGADLLAAGVTPVRIQIHNRTPRAYGFERGDVQLVSQEGERVEPLPIEKAVAKVEPEVAAQMRAKLIGEGNLAAGESRLGYLYFPASAYRRARVVLTDLENDESEGTSIEF